MKGWVIVAQTPNGIWANLLRSYLEGAGIKVWMENEHVQSLFGVTSLSVLPANLAFGPLRLWVPMAQAEKAQFLIREFFSL
ncbi:MAG: DUF2007 domain-containing protein [Bacteroidia bacterium]|nr:DUF2007 domain-containing protein [Bacteroidia bacterium]MDW8015534.1 DUF2007 domain-containing protein [Bacteroidia bacterium]